jgi:hypothetical protein
MQEIQVRLDSMARQIRSLRVGLFLSLACVVTLLMTGAAQEQQLTKDCLTLRSPDGKCTITLKAEDVAGGTSGLWIDQGQERPMVAVVNGRKAGSAFGVYQGHQGEARTAGFDAAIGWDANGSFLQLAEGAGGGTGQGSQPHKMVTLRGQDLQMIQSAAYPQGKGRQRQQQ